MPLTGTVHRGRRTELHRVDPASGRWCSAVAHVGPTGVGRVRIEVGTTGNRLDPERRVRRRGHDLVRADGRLELRSWWPVREIGTNGVGRFFSDLRGELAAAGSIDVSTDTATIAALADEVLEPGPDDLVERVLGSAYPLLRRPLADGARPEEVPLPLEPMLRHRDPRTAAQRTLGPRVTRPLVRALATALLPDDDHHIAWEPILLALMAADRCGPEQLATVLETPPHRPGAVSFSLTDVDRARAMFEDQHPRRVAEDLVDALRADGGTTDLARRLIRHDARPPAPPVAPRPAPRPRDRRAPVPPAEADPGADPGERPIEHPRAWTAVASRTIEGSAGCVVVLPRTGNELLEWGMHMNNCLGAYRTTVSLGRTRIMGFAVDGRLQYAAEISPSRTLRQLEATDNKLPMPSRERAIITWLRRQRLIEADARRLA